MVSYLVRVTMRVKLEVGARPEGWTSVFDQIVRSACAISKGEPLAVA